MKKLLWVKFGWSDYYRGGLVTGNFGWLKQAKGNAKSGGGFEAFNFLPIDGKYYCYVPPQSVKYPPRNKDNNGWTVVCLAKNPKRPGIHIVGWYENATLVGGYWKRPESVESEGADGVPRWWYCITSESAFFVRPSDRDDPFSHRSVRQGKFSFLSGPHVEKTPSKTHVLNLLTNRLEKLRRGGLIVKNPSEALDPDPEIDEADPLSGFGTPEVRKRVEKAAEKAVIDYYKCRGYALADVTKENLGYDFHVSNSKEILNVEVKGTNNKTAGFFLTRNEHEAGFLQNPEWRLAMVTQALSRKPIVKIFNARDLKRAFDIDPYVYIGRWAPESR